MDVLNNPVTSVNDRTGDLLKNVSIQNFNDTSQLRKEVFQADEDLKSALGYLLFSMLIFIMLAMGCEITLAQVYWSETWSNALILILTVTVNSIS